MGAAQDPHERGSRKASTHVTLGAGIGMIFGAALGGVGAGLVLGAAIGLAAGAISGSRRAGGDG